MTIYDFALELFRPQVIKNRKRLKKLNIELRKAQMNIPSEKYLAISFLGILIAFVISIIFLLLIVAATGITFKKLLFAILLPPVIAIGSGRFILYYPKMKSDKRKKRIENALSFATIYLTTMAESSILPKDMFKLMGDLKKYGEISIESKKISEDIEVLGLDLPSAIDRAIKRSPSSEWSEFLSGFKTTVTSGGDTVSYLEEKTKGFTAEYKNKLVAFSKFLTLLVQIYLTVIGVGTVFFIVISSLMGVIGGVSTIFIKTIQYLLVVVGIPMTTVAMIIIIRSISPLTVK